MVRFSPELGSLNHILPSPKHLSTAFTLPLKCKPHEGKDVLIVVAIHLSPGQRLAYSRYSVDRARMIDLVLGLLYATAIVISTLILQVRKPEHGEVNSQTNES